MEFLADVLPQLMVDFLSPMEVLQTVVNEFISPHQSRPELAAVVMAEVSAHGCRLFLMTRFDVE